MRKVRYGAHYLCLSIMYSNEELHYLSVNSHKAPPFDYITVKVTSIEKPGNKEDIHILCFSYMYCVLAFNSPGKSWVTVNLEQLRSIV